MGELLVGSEAAAELDEEEVLLDEEALDELEDSLADALDELVDEDEELDSAAEAVVVGSATKAGTEEDNSAEADALAPG